MNKLPIVAIVGRMNVGKSTLFNRLSTSVKAITLDYAGVTRDVVKDTVTWQNRSFELIDTGGISFRRSEDKLLEKIREKSLQAVEQADVVVFVGDGVVGIVPEDREIARHLQKLGKHVIIVVNKADTNEAKSHTHEFLALGFKHIVSISAQHGMGIHDVLDAILKDLPVTGKQVDEQAAYRVMLLGRPNVGKSSLMNALTKQERSIVSDEPGTTREALAERIAFCQEHLELIDTPGVRRKKSVDQGLESLMVQSSLQTLKQSDIIVLLIDMSQGSLVDQELKLGFYAFADHYKALILLINKEDLATPELTQELDRVLDYYKHFINKIPVLHISCKTGKNVGKVLPLIKKVWDRYRQTLPDAEINRLLVSNLQRKPLMHKCEKLQLQRARQLANAPLTIGLEVNKPDWFGPSQLGFFENLLRKEYDLVGVPIKFIVRNRLD